MAAWRNLLIAGVLICAPGLVLAQTLTCGASATPPTLTGPGTSVLVATGTASFSPPPPLIATWSGGAAEGLVGMTQSVPVATTTTFTVVVSTLDYSLNCTATVTVTVTPPAPPTGCTVSATPSTLPYGGGPVTLLASASGGSPVTSYTWTGGFAEGAGTASVSGTQVATQSYSVTMSNSAGSCTASVEVPVLPPPPPAECAVTATPASLPYGGGPVTLVASSASGGPVASYVWSGGFAQGATTASVSGSIAGTTSFSVTMSNVSGSCTASVSVPVAPPPAPADCSITATPTSLPYTGGTVTLQANIGNGAPVASYVWSGGFAQGATTATVTGFQAATTLYTVTATNISGSCSASVSVPVALPPPGECAVTATPPSLVGAGNVTLVATSGSGGAPTGYAWSGGFAQGATTPSVTGPVAVSTTFSVVITNGSGSCTASTTVTVGPMPPSDCSISASAASLPGPGVVTLVANAGMGDPAASYVWAGGFAAGLITPTVLGIVTQTTVFAVTMRNGGGSCSTSLTVRVGSNPVWNFSPQPPPGWLPPVASLTPAFEYYHAALDHYFVTADAAEIDALDTGVFEGWARTGEAFNVLMDYDTPPPGAPAMQPVCRFYGDPAAGLDSHFYSAWPWECDEVLVRFPDEWVLESRDVFRLYTPDATGACPPGTEPLFRLFNRRSDANHRYTTSPVTATSMLARGYVLEGIGNPAVAMCSLLPVSP